MGAIASTGASRPRRLDWARRALSEFPLVVVCLLLLSTATDILPNDTIVHVGEVQLTLARILILVALVAVVLTHGPRIALFRSGAGLPLLLLLGVGLYASYRWGTYPRYRFLVEGVAAFYLTFAVVRSRDEEGRDALAAIAMVTLAVVALVAVSQVAQDVQTGFYRDGCKPVTLPPGAQPPDGSITRAIGPFTNPNILGGYLLLLLPVGAMSAALVGRLRGLWVAVVFATGLGFLALVFSFSRAAVLVALGAIALGILVSGARYRRWLILVVVLAGAAIALLAGSCGSDAAAGYGRIDEWKQTFEVVKDYPAYGVGLGRLGFVLHARDAASTARHAHNLFLTWWAEAGTGALIAWLWLFGLLVWRSLRGALRGLPGARTGLVAIVGFLGFSMADHPANTDQVALAFWIVAGFAAASGMPPRWWLGRRGRGRPPEDEGLELAAETDIRGRPRTGNVRTVPRGPNE